MNAARNEAGFSLTELLVAMLVTMVVSGAVFTLLSAGQGAFRRQPEMTDRQQNIRMAMDLIQRDIATAGSGMDPFEQSFSRGDGPNETGTLLDGGSLVVGPSTLPADIFEVIGGDGSCNDVPADQAVPWGGGPGSPIVNTAFGLPQCFPADGPVAIIVTGAVDSSFWGLSGPTPPGGVQVPFTGAQPAKANLAGAGPGGPTAVRLVPMQIARYAILVDPVTQVPELWRSGRGGLNAGGARTPIGDATGGWQLIARGIEDMQVRYRMQGDPPFPNAACCGSPRVAGPGLVANVVQEVEVTLWARTLAPDLQGQTQPLGAAVAAVRGSLTTVTAPRAALLTLNTAVPPLWR